MRVPTFLGEGDRYEIEREIGRGGMGAVYRALDKNTGQRVAIKLMLDGTNSEAIALFDKEWRILGELQHPNIIGISDRGDFWDGNMKLPYFVMPYLRGKTLQDLVHGENAGLTVERVVQIITAAAGSLNVAHSRGVIHRDIKPSNIFVLDTGAVVVIDFGVVHLADSGARTTLKGTAPYMAPELLVPRKHEKPTPQSDLFSLGVVCYEALTGKNPFARATTDETVHAILHEIPRPAYELNMTASLLLSQVVQKAMAKDRNHRFRTASEFADRLERAFRSEPLPEFSREAIEDRLRVVREAIAKGQTTSADELLRSIEEDGLVDPNITNQREKIDQVLQQKWIREQLESARLYRDAKQYAAALDKLTEVLRTDPENIEAQTERDSIEQERLANTLNEARSFMLNHRFADARRSIEEARTIRPRDTQTTELLGELARMEEADRQLAEQKAALYQEAENDNREGYLATALQKLEKLMQLIRDAGPNNGSDRDPIYKNLYDNVFAEHRRIQQARDEVKGHLTSGKLSQAITVCDQALAANPGFPLFEAFRLEAENRDRDSRLEYVHKVCTGHENVPDLEMRVSLLQEAITRCPGESQLTELLRNAKSRRDLINSLIAKARRAESGGRYAESLERWYTIKECHAQQPGLDNEIQRIEQLRADELRATRRTGLIQDVSRSLRAGEYQRAAEQCRIALTEFPRDAELLALHSDANDKVLRAPEVQRLIQEGRRHLHDGKTEPALETLRRAAGLDRNNQQVRQFLGIALLDKATATINDDWRTADQLLTEAKDLIPDHPELKSMTAQISERKRTDAVQQAFETAERLSSAGDVKGAIAELETALKTYPGERRLLQEWSRLRRQVDEAAPSETPAFVDRSTVSQDPAYSSLNSVFNRSPGSTITPEPSPPPVPEREPIVPRFRKALAGGWAKTRERGAGVYKRLEIAVRLRLPDTAAAKSVQSAFAKLRAVTEDALPENFPYKPVLAAVLVVGVITGTWVVYRVATGQQTPAPVVVVLPSPTTLHVATIPEGAAILIDGKPMGTSDARSDLPPGNHSVEVALAGYESQTLPVTLGSERMNLNVELRPLPLELRLVSDQVGGRVWLDDEVKGELAADGTIISAVTPGTHTLKVQSSQGEVAAAFDFQPGQIPTTTMPTSRTPTILFVGSLAGRVRAACNCTAKLKVGDSDQPLRPEATELNLPEGQHQAVLGVLGGKKLTLASGQKPMATVAMYWGEKPRPPAVASNESLLRDANAQVVAGRYPEAKAAIRQVLSRDPANQQAMILLRKIERLEALGPSLKP